MFESVFIGFLARKVASRPQFLGDAPIVDVCSVSECISPGAPDRLRSLAHNCAGFYDTETLAWSVVPKDEADEYTLFAYRALSVRFDTADSEPWSPADEWRALPADADLSAYVSIGYDIVNGSLSPHFECSPLSCNSIANGQAVNEHCLVDEVDEALRLASLFAGEVLPAEPGSYFVAEVLRRAQPGLQA